MSVAEKLKNLEEDRQNIAKDHLQATLTEIFTEYPEINIISWGQKDSEYDDEGMYPGVNGPVFNYDFFDEVNKDNWNNLEMEIIQGYGSYRKSDTDGWEKIFKAPNAERKLMSALNDIGSELLVKIFDDADEYIVSAERKDDGTFKIYKESIRY